MKRALQIIAILVVVGFAAIQFVRPDVSNPVSNEADEMRTVENMPEDLRARFKTSCDDCHSNRTEYPFYSYVAPISWSVADHINEGREELNFSAWKGYSIKRKARKLEEICEEIEENSMPHYQYLWIHWDAALDEKTKKQICLWTEESIRKYKTQEDS